LDNLLGGLEAFLLVIFAVALENLFVQTLGLPGSIGQAIKRRSRLVWLGTMLGVGFLFYHTLINPRGELADALRESNVWLLFGVGITFVLLTFGLRAYFARRTRAETRPAASSHPQPVSVQVAVPTPKADAPAPVPAKEKVVVAPVLPVESPASDALPADSRPCPHCGQVIKRAARLCRHCRKPVTPMADSAPAVSAVIPSAPEIPADSKQCPKCRNIIKLEARLCRFCRARFDVQTRGYCLNDHVVVDVKDGKCILCGRDAQDVHTESKLVGTPIPAVPPAAPSRTPAVAAPVVAESVTATVASPATAARTPFWKIYLSPKGRIGRLTFFVKGILPVLGLLGLTFYILSAIIDSMNTSGSPGVAGAFMSIGMIILLLEMLFLYWVLLVLIIKRLHDLGRSGWNILLWLIPLAGQFINLWNWFEFLFVKGTAGPNKFGDRTD
jgi:uncharacterized membrane protein YhaH (DUF805 family)